MTPNGQVVTPIRLYSNIANSLLWRSIRSANLATAWLLVNYMSTMHCSVADRPWSLYRLWRLAAATSRRRPSTWGCSRWSAGLRRQTRMTSVAAWSGSSRRWWICWSRSTAGNSDDIARLPSASCPGSVSTRLTHSWQQTGLVHRRLLHCLLSICDINRGVAFLSPGFTGAASCGCLDISKCQTWV